MAVSPNLSHPLDIIPCFNLTLKCWKLLIHLSMHFVVPHLKRRHNSWFLTVKAENRLQQYMNCELPDVQARFRKGRGTRDQIANIRWIMEKAREFQKNIYFCFMDYAKAFDCVDHNKLWKILKEMGIPDHLICLLRNVYAGQEATVRSIYRQYQFSLKTDIDLHKVRK